MCSGCGQPRHESFAKANAEAYDGDASTCHACAELARVGHKVAGRNPAEHPGGGVYIALSGPH